MCESITAHLEVTAVVAAAGGRIWIFSDERVIDVDVDVGTEYNAAVAEPVNPRVDSLTPYHGSL